MKNGFKTIFLIFFISLILITILGEGIRNYTSPTVVVTSNTDQIPNSAFIEGDHLIYVVYERGTSLGKEYYIRSMEVAKENTDLYYSMINSSSLSGNLIVIGNDRPLKDYMRVKFTNYKSSTMIHSKYRDVVLLKINLPLDQLSIITNDMKQHNKMIREIWYEKDTSDSSTTLLYIKGDQGCSEIIQNQLPYYFTQGNIASLINLELEFRKIEFMLRAFLSIIVLFISSKFFKYLLSRYKLQKDIFHQERSIYYLKNCIYHNRFRILHLIILTIIMGGFIFLLLWLLPDPALPAWVIPEKIIYYKEYIHNLSLYLNQEKVIIPSKVIYDLNRYRVIMGYLLFSAVFFILAYTIIRVIVKKRHDRI